MLPSSVSFRVCAQLSSIGAEGDWPAQRVLETFQLSALTILGETHQQKNITKNTMRCMDGPKVIHHHHHHHHDFRATRQSEGAMRRGVVAWRGMAWPWP
jgi:hypothetical protein